MYLLLMLLSCHSTVDVEPQVSVDTVYSGFELQKERLWFNMASVPTNVRLEFAGDVPTKVKLQLTKEVDYAALYSRHVPYDRQD